MDTYYIPHNVKSGDIAHLADSDSIFAIDKGISEEDLIEVQAKNGLFYAQVTYIEKNSVEVEIGKQISDLKLTSDFNLTIIQGISNITKFGLFLEKITEIGCDRVIPLYTDLSIIDVNKAKKDFGLWQKIIVDAKEQSRNPNPPLLEKIISIKDVKSYLNNDTLKLCLTTENVKTQSLPTEKINRAKDIVIVCGSETGWSFQEIEEFRSLGFIFVRLQGNILRTETTPIVVTSIINFIKHKL